MRLPPRRRSASRDRPILRNLSDSRGSLLEAAKFEDESEDIPEIRKKYEKVTTDNNVAPQRRSSRSIGDRRERKGMLLSRKMLILPERVLRSLGLYTRRMLLLLIVTMGRKEEIQEMGRGGVEAGG